MKVWRMKINYCVQWDVSELLLHTWKCAARFVRSTTNPERIIPPFVLNYLPRPAPLPLSHLSWVPKLHTHSPHTHLPTIQQHQSQHLWASREGKLNKFSSMLLLAVWWVWSGVEVKWSWIILKKTWISCSLSEWERSDAEQPNKYRFFNLPFSFYLGNVWKSIYGEEKLSVRRGEKETWVKKVVSLPRGEEGSRSQFWQKCVFWNWNSS